VCEVAADEDMDSLTHKHRQKFHFNIILSTHNMSQICSNLIKIICTLQWCSQGQNLKTKASINPQGQGQGMDLRGEGRRSRGQGL